jgi:hypothetical protein
MSGGGTDPFSNTTTRNLLQHIISPKVVSDGATGYAVKTDLINIDNAYVNNNLYVDTLTVQDNNTTNADKMVLRTNGGQSYITTTTSAGARSALILTNSGTEVKNQNNSGNGTLLLQTDTSGNGYVRAGYSGGGSENLYLGTQALNSVTIAPSGNMSVTGTITGSIGGRATGTLTANNGSTVVISNSNVTANSIILLTVKTPTGANAGQAYVVSKTASTGFSIVSGAADTSVYNYIILN